MRRRRRTVPDVRIEVYSDVHGTPKNLKDVETSLDKMEKGAGVADKTMGGLWKQFAIGELAVKALNKAYAIGKDLVLDGIKNAMEQEKVETALKAALEITGRTVEGNLKHYLDFAAAQQKVTLYTDEEIEACQALLLQLTNLNQQGIDRAVKGAMGLATVMGTDLQAATMTVTKAMEGNFVALGRVGIKVDENLTAGKKQASLLDQLEKLYKRTTAETDTFGGSVEQLNISFGEVLETFGKTITNSDTAKKSLEGLKKAVDDLNTIASQEGKNWVDYLAGKAKYIPIVAVVNKNIEWMTEKLHKEAEEVRYNESVYDGLKIALSTYDKILMNLGIDIEKITGGFIRHAKAVDQVGDALPPLVGKLKETIVPMDRAKLASGALQLALQTLGLTGLRLGESLVPAARNLDRLAVLAANVGLKLGETFVPAIRNLDKLAAKMGHISPEWKKHLEEMKNKTQETMNKIFGVISGVISQIDGIYQQSTNNRMLALDNEYQKRLDKIKNSLISEEEKNKAIEGLDAEYNIKRRGVQSEAAKQGKALAIVNAMISVAEGIAKALGAAPPPFNIILAAITAALGAVQIAFIKAQPIPLAAGAIFQKPVFSQNYVAGEAGPEAVIPLSELPRLMRELGGGRGRGQAERPIVSRVHIFLDGREMKSFTTKTVKESGRLGYLGKVGKEMA